MKEGDEPNIDIYFWLSTRAEGSKTIPAGWSIDITEHGMCTTHSFNAERVNTWERQHRSYMNKV